MALVWSQGSRTPYRVYQLQMVPEHKAEEKIRIVLEGLRGEGSIAELCCGEGIAQCLYYKWSKEIPEAGKKRLTGDTERQVTTVEIKDLRRDMHDLEKARASLSSSVITYD